MKLTNGIRSTIQKILWVGTDQTLGRLDRILSQHQGQPPWPPIIIVGLSRSGTTLLYQCLVTGLSLCYISNLNERISTIPVLTSLISRLLGGSEPPRNYDSHFGITKGWNAPNSASSLWKRWFADKYPGSSTTIVQEINRTEMIGTISLIEKIYKVPFINKWTPNSTRILELASCFPGVLFIWVTRDYFQTAQSILKARIEVTGDPNKSFITWPEGFEQNSDLPYIDNICQHILRIENTIEKGCEILGNDRFIKISYEQLCSSPRETIEHIREFYFQQTGYEIVPRFTLPEGFLESRSIKIDHSEAKALSNRLFELGLDHIPPDSLD